MSLTAHEIRNLENVKTLIEKDFKTHYSIEQLAGVALMSRSKLIKAFRLAYRKGLFEYLQQYRLNLAKTLLDNSSLSIKVISYRCGYRHPCNFSTAFKQAYGVSPVEYRGLLF